MIVPSHFVPLAAPGMVALGLKWMWNPASPFYIKPRLSPDLLAWGFRFWRAATPQHVDARAPLLRDLSLASRGCLRGAGRAAGQRLRPREARACCMLCRTRHAPRRGSQDRGDGPTRSASPAEVLDAQADGRARSRRADGHRRRRLLSRRTATSRPIDSCASLQAELPRRWRCEFVWNTEVTGWRRRAATAVVRRSDARRGEYRADEFVLCGGVVVAAARARTRPHAADAGGQGLQPHAARIRASCPRSARS